MNIISEYINRRTCGRVYLRMAATADTVLWILVRVSMLAMEATPRPSSDNYTNTNIQPHEKLYNTVYTHHSTYT